MGKTQKKRAMRRHNPMRVPDSHLQHGLTSASASTSTAKKDAVLPVIEKLASQDQQERIWACAAVSNLIQNDPSTRRLLQGKNLVGALIARLSDTIEEVVVEAAGALRNLCIDGGYEICAEMFNKGILPPLQAFVPKISSMLDQLLLNPKSAPENATRLAYELAETVITIFWCLSETSNKALNAVNQVNLIPFLMAFLESRAKLPIATVNAAAQCLYVLTEENDPAIEELRMNSNYISCLLNVVQEGPPIDPDERVITLRTLACAILRNICPLPPMLPAASIDLDRAVIVPFLVPLLDISLHEISTNVEQLVTTQASEKKQPIITGAKFDHKSESTVQLERIEAKLRTVQLALELLTTVCAQLPESAPLTEEEEEEEEWEEVNEDDEMEADEEMVEDAPPTNGTSLNNGPKKPSDYLEALIPTLLPLIRPTSLSYAPPFQQSLHPPTTSALGALHIAALECLNNVSLTLADALDSVPLENTGLANGAGHSSAAGLVMSAWGEVWSMLASIGRPEGIGAGPEKKKEAWLVALGVLWAVGRICRGQLIPDAEQVQLLIEICNTVPDDASKVKCIGILECVAVHPSSVEANKVISSYLLSLLPTKGTTTSQPPEALIQATSSVIDIFSDESSPWDVNFRQGQWENQLAQSVDGVRKAVKSIDKRRGEDGRELRRRGEEVLENLVAFVRYRRRLKL